MGRCGKHQLGILIADDAPAMRELLSVLVETAGIGRVVAVASDGIEAVELALARSPEVALLDVEMPRLTGLAAAEVIRNARPETQVVLHSGHDDPETRARARSLEIPFVGKITDADVLAATISASAPPAPATEPVEITAVVLAALERGAQESVMVIDAAGNAIYYDSRAAEILELPLPPHTIAHEELRRHAEHVTAEGAARPVGERPLFRALAERRVIDDVVYTKRRDTIAAWATRAVPILDSEGEISAVAVYWKRLPDR
jgi:DNA-binding NarL/FixJ family response regulator